MSGEIRPVRNLGAIRWLCGLALAVLLLHPTAPANAKPGVEELLGPLRFGIDIDRPVFDTITQLRTQGIDVFQLGPGVPDERERFDTWLRILREGRSTYVPVQVRLTHLKDRTKILVRGSKKRKGKTDTIVKLTGDIAGGELTGKVSVTEKTEGSKLRNEPVSGNLPRGSRATFRIDFHLEGNVDPKGRLIPTLDASLFSSRGQVGIEKWSGKTTAAKSGPDKVQIKGKGTGGSFKFRGTNDGDRLVGTMDVKIGKRKERGEVDTPSSRPTPAGAFSVGSGSTDVTLPSDGMLTTELVVETTGGVCYTVPAGSRLLNAAGQLLTGPVRVSIDEGDFPAPFPEAPPLAQMYLGATLLDATNLPIGSSSFVIDSSESGDVPTLELPPPVSRFALLPVDPRLGAPPPFLRRGAGFEGGFRTDSAATPGNGAYSDSSTLRGFPVASGLYVIDGVTPSVVPAGGAESFLVPIDGDDSSEFPRLKRVTILDRNTGAFLASLDSPTSEGLTLGETATAHRADGSSAYDVRVEGAAGGRRLRLTTPFSNGLRIIYTYCDALGNLFTRIVTTGDGEYGSGGQFIGPVVIRIPGAGDLMSPELHDVLGPLGGAVFPGAGWSIRPAPGQATTSTLILDVVVEPFAADSFFDIDVFIDVVESTPPPLGGGGLVPEVDGNRLTVEPPGVSNNIAVGAVDVENLTLNTFIGTDVVSVDTTGLGRPGNITLARNGCRTYIVRDDETFCMYEKGVEVDCVKIPCLTQAVEVGWLGYTVNVTTTKGELLVLDALTLKVLSRFGGFPTDQTFSSMAGPRDGRCVWFCGPDSNQIYGFDLLRGVAKTPVPTVVAPDFMHLSADGMRIGYANRPLSRVGLQALDGSPPRILQIPVANTAQCAFGGNSLYYTAQGGSASGDGLVGRIDIDTFTITNFATGLDDPTGLALIPSATPGEVTVVVGDFSARELVVFNERLVEVLRRQLPGFVGQMGSSSP